MDLPEQNLTDAMTGLKRIWHNLRLPESALASVELAGKGHVLPSSFKVADLAQSTIGTTALLASMIYAKRHGLDEAPTVRVDRENACAEFSSERLFTMNGIQRAPSWGPIGGLHKTLDGHVRIHDNFKHHREGTCRMLGLPVTATRDQVAEEIAKWRALELEATAAESGVVISALRTFDQWDATPQATALPDFPVQVTKLTSSQPLRMAAKDGKCLEGLRVLEMSRVIAAPVAGRTLAAHGADVLWVTSPQLPDLPGSDPDVSRGKRTAQIHFTENGRSLNRLLQVIDSADVFLQGYRPGSLAAKGLSVENLLARRPDDRPLIYASLTAYGRDGPWNMRRGFDSLVQTCSGFNVSEAEHFGKGGAAKPMPCQALDHGAGYFLAAGIMTALYRQMTEGGSYRVDVSLAAVMKYLRSLGQHDSDSGFAAKGYSLLSDVPSQFVESRNSAFGQLDFVRHAARIHDVDVGWDIMPKPLGSDELAWLPRTSAE